MDYKVYLKSIFGDIEISDELLDSFIFQAELTLKNYGILALDSEGKENKTYTNLLGLFVGCQLQKGRHIKGGEGIISSQTNKDFTISYSNPLVNTSSGTPNQGGYCDMFNYLSKQEALRIKSVGPIIFNRGCGI